PSAGHIERRRRASRKANQATHLEHGREVGAEHELEVGGRGAAAAVGDGDPLVQAAGQVALALDLKWTGAQVPGHAAGMRVEPDRLRALAVDEHVVLGQEPRVAEPQAVTVDAVRLHGAVARRDSEQAVLLDDYALAREEVLQD